MGSHVQLAEEEDDLRWDEILDTETDEELPDDYDDEDEDEDNEF